MTLAEQKRLERRVVRLERRIEELEQRIVELVESLRDADERIGQLRDDMYDEVRDCMRRE